ncbi:MAG: oxygen-independent coproporphyrinogen III oxidase [bacterium]
MSSSTLPRVTAELLARYDRPGPRYTSYPTAVEFHDGFGADEESDALTRANAQPDEPLSLYFHIPFCESMCTFCGCSVVIRRDHEAAAPYLERLRREIELVAERLPDRRKVVQLHWGGGTPNFLSEARMGALFETITRHFTLTPDAEVALEIDPRTASPSQIDFLRGLGFNRVSMGIQDFTPEVQQAVNRIQPEAMTRSIFDRARERGFESINVDLIYGLPFQTEETFQRTLDAVVNMAPDRVAVFSFAYVPWLKPHQRKIDAASMPATEAKFALFARAIETFAAAGYQQIGMDHFAKPGDELCRALERRKVGRNFQGYTVKETGDLIGFGMTAIGDVQGSYAQNLKELGEYFGAIDAGRLATHRGILLTEEDKLRRFVITALMCNFAVSPAEVEARFDVRFREHFARELAELAPLLDEGFIQDTGDWIEVTPLGRLFIRNVAMPFDTYLKRKSGEKPVFSRTV